MGRRSFLRDFLIRRDKPLMRRGKPAHVLGNIFGCRTKGRAEDGRGGGRLDGTAEAVP